MTYSGSVSSFNDYDEDYEVGEDTEDEEQEEPGDYIKGEVQTGQPTAIAPMHKCVFAKLG